jgi:hypothetical protein
VCCPAGLSSADADLIVERAYKKLRPTVQSPLFNQSPADRGDMELRRVKDSGKYFMFRGSAGGASIIPQDFNFDDSWNRSEAMLNANLYSHLRPIFADNGSCLVNSERIKWLPVRPGTPVTVFDKMPDLFGCPPWLYEPKPSYNTDSDELKALWIANGVQFGSMPWSVREGLDLTCETKRIYNNAGLVELLDYQARIGEGISEEVRGLYMWDTGFMMVVVHRGDVMEITECTWKTSGSRQLLQDFIKRPKCIWRMGLEKLCARCNCTLVDNASFLGRGGNGFVFKVQIENELEVRALKIVVGAEACDRLSQEVEIISKHCKDARAQEHIVSLYSTAVITVSSILDTTTAAQAVPAAGYLMNSVGTAAPKQTAQQRYDIFMALVYLHRLGIVHGDARYPNIIDVNDKLIWIDFFDSKSCASHCQFKNDAINLFKTMYACIYLCEDVMNMLEEYSTDVVNRCPSFHDFCTVMEES